MYKVIDRLTNESHGAYDTLDEARGCVTFDRLAEFQIWAGDNVVEESEAAFGDSELHAKADEIRIQATHCARAQCVAVHNLDAPLTPCQTCVDAATRILASYAVTFGSV